MRVVVWLSEGTWEACVDAAHDLRADEIVLLHVIDPASVEAVEGAQAGLLGRGISPTGSAMTAALAAKIGRAHV